MKFPKNLSSLFTLNSLSLRLKGNSRRLLALLLLLTIAGGNTVSAATVSQAVTSLQTVDPSLPTGVPYPKGIIGYILANIFGTSGSSLGKIQSQYIDLSSI